MYDPRRLLTLRAVVAEGSFSAAARALSLTQPAVSQQVAALEREVGARLLDRGAGGPTPTKAGALLLAHADALADHLVQADAQMAELREVRAPLRVGAFASALAVLVPGAIAAAAGLRVHAVEGRLPDLRAGVASGELHVALGFQDVRTEPVAGDGVERHDLGEEDFVALVGPRHRLARRRTIRLEELAGDVWTAPSTTGLLMRACREAGFAPEVAYVTSDPLAIRAIVAAGLAVTLAPRLVAALPPGGVVLALRGTPPRRAVFALTPAVGARPEAAAFVEALRATWSRR
ncbi:MAG: LysR family transcriptional regulator [Actinomycetota bacterium]|nr:LysR family transcriptional regulator [Actinomycetota bacterium]